MLDKSGKSHIFMEMEMWSDKKDLLRCSLSSVADGVWKWFALIYMWSILPAFLLLVWESIRVHRPCKRAVLGTSAQITARHNIKTLCCQTFSVQNHPLIHWFTTSSLYSAHWTVCSTVSSTKVEILAEGSLFFCTGTDRFSVTQL